MSMEDHFIFGAVASNASKLPDIVTPLTLEKVLAMAEEFERLIPPPLVPNPCDVGPITYAQLKSQCHLVDTSDLTNCQFLALTFSDIQVHMRPDVTEFAIHPCTCNERDTANDASRNPNPCRSTDEPISRQTEG